MARTWSPARMEMLRRLVSERKSAGEIAAAISEKFGMNITRNAVIWQAHRNKIALGGGFTGRPRTGAYRKPNDATRLLGAGVMGNPKKVGGVMPSISRPATAERHGGVAPSKLLRLPTPPVETPVTIPVSGLVALVELREGMCKWPVARANEEWMFCGAEKPDDVKPFCQHHAAIAYPTVTKRVVSEETRRKQRLAALKAGSNPFRMMAKA